jgi:hypothetical protein
MLGGRRFGNTAIAVWYRGDGCGCPCVASSLLAKRLFLTYNVTQRMSIK